MWKSIDKVWISVGFGRWRTSRVANHNQIAMWREVLPGVDTTTTFHSKSFSAGEVVWHSDWATNQIECWITRTQNSPTMQFHAYPIDWYSKQFALKFYSFPVSLGVINFCNCLRTPYPIEYHNHIIFHYSLYCSGVVVGLAPRFQGVPD